PERFGIECPLAICAFRVECAVGFRGDTASADGLVYGGIADAAMAGVGADGDADCGSLLW
ncbi:MAG TPA: hypothetical protein PKZ52_17785, partial [Cellvibrionaceae bacterium]|nr:hypothetical protein [Cellvibrionaceae bacterium]